MGMQISCLLHIILLVCLCIPCISSLTFNMKNIYVEWWTDCSFPWWFFPHRIKEFSFSPMVRQFVINNYVRFFKNHNYHLLKTVMEAKLRKETGVQQDESEKICVCVCHFFFSINILKWEGIERDRTLYFTLHC